MFVAAVSVLSVQTTSAQKNGLLTKDAHLLFPIGSYELPKDDAPLKMMAEAGINLVRCHSKADLDRAQAAGMMGWMPLDMHLGATDELRSRVESVRDHPALAVWEGPDELVWNFTAASQLRKKLGVHKSEGEWGRQTPGAVEYAEKQAQQIMPRLREGIQLVRSLDGQNRPVWINEALQSDVKYVRQYIDHVDITGCDLYPVRRPDRPIAGMGAATERWKQVGRGKPVWMVLQAFSWSELGDYYGEKTAAYPTFAESRFMAYDVIAHGAKGIIYWGSHYLKSDAFRQSLYALTSELAALQPFLIAPEEPNARLTLIEMPDPKANKGVRLSARKSATDWLIVLVNEDETWHMGVEVSGLEPLNGQRLVLLYDSETVAVERGELITRMPPLAVKVFATGRTWETDRRSGRNFGE